MQIGKDIEIAVEMVTKKMFSNNHVHTEFENTSGFKGKMVTTLTVHACHTSVPKQRDYLGFNNCRNAILGSISQRHCPSRAT